MKRVDVPNSPLRSTPSGIFPLRMARSPPATECSSPDAYEGDRNESNGNASSDEPPRRDGHAPAQLVKLRAPGVKAVRVVFFGPLRVAPVIVQASEAEDRQTL